MGCLPAGSGLSLGCLSSLIIHVPMTRSLVGPANVHKGPPRHHHVHFSVLAWLLFGNNYSLLLLFAG